MKEWTFWEVVKKKAVLILGITIVATFVFIKAVDFVLNWCFNNEPVVYGHRTNYTVVGFMPFIFVIAFIITTNIIKRRLNSSGGEQQLNKQEHYTWSDIFKEKESILLYMLVSVAIFASLHFSIQKISTLSNKHAVASLADTSVEGLAIVSAIVGAFLFVFLQRTLVVWLKTTELGNKTLGLLVLVFGVITMAVMCGINYLWTPAEEIAESIQDDFAIGLLIPFDVSTMIFTLATFWLWKTARKCKLCNKEWINTGLIIAIISLVISFTPLQLIIQGIFISITRGMDTLKV